MFTAIAVGSVELAFALRGACDVQAIPLRR
jgi:hypothetical protein